MHIQVDARECGHLFRCGIVLLLSYSFVQSAHSSTEQAWDFRTGLHGWKGSHRIIHAPCSVKDISLDPNGTLQFSLDGWGGLDRSASYSVLVSGVGRAPQRILKVSSAHGRRGSQALNFRYVTLNRSIGYVIVDLTGPALVRVEP